MKRIRAYQNSPSSYIVHYDNGYDSWSPKDVFELAYLPVDEINDNLAEKLVLTQSHDTVGHAFVLTTRLRTDFVIVTTDVSLAACHTKAILAIKEHLRFVAAWAKTGLFYPSVGPKSYDAVHSQELVE